MQGNGFKAENDWQININHLTFSDILIQRRLSAQNLEKDYRTLNKVMLIPVWIHKRLQSYWLLPCQWPSGNIVWLVVWGKHEFWNVTGSCVQCLSWEYGDRKPLTAAIKGKINWTWLRGCSVWNRASHSPTRWCSRSKLWKFFNSTIKRVLLHM